MEFNNNQLKQVTFKAGDVLFHENDESFHFYIIQYGVIEIYKTTAEGKKIVLAEASDGTAIGEFAMIDRRPRSASAVCKTEVGAVEVSEEAYRLLLEELPDWAVAVMRGLVERLRNAHEIIHRIEGIDQKTTQEIDKAEFDPDKSTVTRTPFDDFDDTPDLA